MNPRFCFSYHQLKYSNPEVDIEQINEKIDTLKILYFPDTNTWYKLNKTTIMKTVLITGCSRGIGKAIAEKFVSEGYTVIGTSTGGNSEIQTTNFEMHILDLGKDHSIQSFIKKIEGRTVKIMINNAAILLEDWDNPKPDLQQLRQTFEVNVFGTINLTENMLPAIEYGGHIINMSSGWGQICLEGIDKFVPHYKMSKVALNMYTRLLAARLHGRITVSAYNPGWVKTDMGTSSAPKMPETVAGEFYKFTISNIESGRFWSGNRKINW